MATLAQAMRSRQADGAEQDPQGRLDIADDELASRTHSRRESGADEHRRRALLWKQRNEVRGHARQLGLHLAERATLTDSGEAGGCEAAELDVGRIECGRPPELCLRVGEREARRHHADDLCHCAGDFDTPTNDRRVAAEAALPEPVAQQDHGWGAGSLVLHGECPAHPWGGSHHIEERRRDGGRCDTLGIVRPGEAYLAVVEQRNAVECAALGRVQKVERIRHRQVELHESGRGVLEDDEPVGVGHRQRTQQHRVDDAEDGDVGADADGQRHDRDGREARAGGESAQEDAHLRHKGNGSALPA